jgi:hypothetical protein
MPEHSPSWQAASRTRSCAPSPNWARRFPAGHDRAPLHQGRNPACLRGKQERYAEIRRDAGAGMSERAIERKHHVGRRTIIKALYSADPPARKKIHREPAALKGLHNHIDSMIEADPRDRHRHDLAAPRRRPRRDRRLPDPSHLRHQPPRTIAVTRRLRSYLGQPEVIARLAQYAPGIISSRYINSIYRTDRSPHDLPPEMEAATCPARSCMTPSGLPIR